MPVGLQQVVLTTWTPFVYFFVVVAAAAAVRVISSVKIADESASDVGKLKRKCFKSDPAWKMSELPTAWKLTSFVWAGFRASLLGGYVSWYSLCCMWGMALCGMESLLCQRNQCDVFLCLLNVVSYIRRILYAHEVCMKWTYVSYLWFLVFFPVIHSDKQFLVDGCT